jgi:hypothetical protein
MKDLKGYMAEKFGKPKKADQLEKEAKMSVVKDLRDAASDDMKESLKSGMMQKVTVAAPDKEGLKKGLEKAEDVLEELPEEGNPVEMADALMGEKEDDDMEEDMDMNKDEKIAMLEEKLKDLQEMLAKMKS